MIPRYAVAAIVAVALLPFGGDAPRKTARGNERFREGRYEEALRFYTEAQVERPDAPELHYDIGNVLYRLDDLEGAAGSFSRALHAAGPELAPPAAFNLGNTRFRQADFAGAIASFEEALRADPADRDAKRNLEIAILALQRRQQPPDAPGEEQEERADERPRAEKGGEEDREPEPPQSPEPEGREPEADAAGRQESGMTPQQAERLLDGLQEQELANLRRRALREAAASRTAAEEDW